MKVKFWSVTFQNEEIGTLQKISHKTMYKYGSPKIFTTDKLATYCAAFREIGVPERQLCGGRANNRCENSHLPFRRRERAMQKFKNCATLQCLTSLHSQIYNHFNHELVLTIALAITVAVAIKVVGVLLIAAMLIIPAAAARPLSRTPEGMAVAAGLIGVLSAIIGLRVAFVLDMPAGPSIVCVAAITFLVTSILRGFRHAR
jgi:hypothetical protein